MTYYYTGFVRSPGGLLKMIQILIGLVLMLILMAGHYDTSTGLYRLRVDAFLMTMTVFTFILTSALILMCTIMGETDMPNSVIYRINYLLATVTYLPFTVGFIFEEYVHGDINQTIAGGVLSITNSFVYMFNLCISYEPRCLKGRRRSQLDSPRRGKKRTKGGRRRSKSKASGKKTKKGAGRDTILNIDVPERVPRIRTERDILARGDLRTFQQLQQIQQLNRMAEMNPEYAIQRMNYLDLPVMQPGQPAMMMVPQPVRELGQQVVTETAQQSIMEFEEGSSPRTRPEDKSIKRMVMERYRGQLLPGDEILRQKPVGREYMIPITMEGTGELVRKGVLKKQPASRPVSPTMTEATASTTDASVSKTETEGTTKGESGVPSKKGKKKKKNENGSKKSKKKKKKSKKFKKGSKKSKTKSSSKKKKKKSKSKKFKKKGSKKSKNSKKSKKSKKKKKRKKKKKKKSKK